MRIARITAYRLDLPFKDGAYVVSGGRAALGFDATVVALHTDGDVTGWGEMAPLGAAYDPAFAGGARAALEELAPLLLGEDPTQVVRLNRRMDAILMGHNYAKAAIDMACWDILGKTAGMPLAELLGGRYGETVDLYRSVSQDAPAVMAQRATHYTRAGYRRIQVKVGGDPAEDVARVRAVAAAVPRGTVLFADANGGWALGDARRFVGLARDLDLTLEQPCRSLADCAALRPHCPFPLVLDESIDGLAALLAARGLADGVTLKLARVGGVTKARQLRDAAVELGMKVTVEDTGGSDIDTAAMAHLSLSTPEAFRLHTVDFNNWVTVSNATGMPEAKDGRLAAPTAPGLGVTPRMEVLGEPFLEVG
ncbi:MAG: mandelate racemase [Alphaproteobacteria bacterium]|nr:mandelate racemase [Alphaproteobacteria bacterium]